MAEFDFLLTIDLFKKGLSEQRAVLVDFWGRAKLILDDSGINLKPIPERWLSLRHNYFSVLFIVAFFALEIPLPRLRLYARVNHCLRAWVTSCDNLLDSELKELFLTDLPDDAWTFKSVHTILVADRIFFLFLLDAVRDRIITGSEMKLLLRTSLSSISASGREEAEEEEGVDYNVSPEDILNKVHHAKTGLLFTSPLIAPLALGDIDDHDDRVRHIRQGLSSFGLGCQILDDLSDLGTDLMNRKHNYLAALIMSGEDCREKDLFLELLAGERVEESGDNTYLYQRFPEASALATAEAKSQFNRAVGLLCRGGMPLDLSGRQMFLGAIMKIFDHPKLMIRLRQ